MKVKELLDYLNSKPLDFDVLIEIENSTNGELEILEIQSVYNDYSESEIYLVVKI